MREGTAAEFSAIRNYPHADVRHCPGKRVSSVYVGYLGTPVAEKHTDYCRGKEVSTTFYVNEEFINQHWPAGLMSIR